MPHQIGRLTWSPDSASIAFVSGIMSDEGNISGEVYIVPASGGDARCISPDIDHSITWIEWRDDGILYGGRHIDSAVLGWIDPETASHHLISKGMYAINGYGAQSVQAARNRTFAAVRESFTEPPNVYIGSLDGGEWASLTDFPLKHGLFPPLRVENRHWRNPDGTPVHGFLVYPPDYKPGKRYPLVAHVHGGPSWSYVPRYLSPWERLLTAMGCLVLMPNPRGSWGRGHAYQSANVGDLGGRDWQDINAGIDVVIDEGLADPDRLAICGWSYGGYLVAWAVTQTDRFRCAIAGASITSYESNYGVVSNREWQTTMFGSNVYDDYERHRSRSPIAYVSRVKTPTLLVHGEKDTLAPVQQAIEFYVALKHFGVPTQLVIYPREPHGFEERAHQIDLYQRIVGWVDKYLFE
jgi:dipeptidyl aminopeptidase/acylaminoacyl peptidase